VIHELESLAFRVETCEDSARVQPCLQDLDRDLSPHRFVLLGPEYLAEPAFSEPPHHTVPADGHGLVIQLQQARQGLWRHTAATAAPEKVFNLRAQAAVPRAMAVEVALALLVREIGTGLEQLFQTPVEGDIHPRPTSIPAPAGAIP